MINSSFDQSSFEEEYDEQETTALVDTILTTTYIVFAILGMVGNGLVLIVIARIKDLQDVTNLFIANQSLIDFTASFFLLFGFVIPVPALPKDRPTLSSFICSFWYTKYPFWSMIVASCLNVAVITLERYIAVFFPIYYRVSKISGKTISITFIPWICGFLFQIILLSFSKVENGQCFEFLWPDEATKIGICLTTYLLEFLIPVGTMIFVYARIFYQLRRKSDPFSQPANSSSLGENEGKAIGRINVDYRIKARKNTIKTLVTVSTCFVICLSLNQHIYLAYGFGMDLNFAGSMYITSVVMAFGNIWINPLVYTFQYQRFQRGIQKLFWPTKSQQLQVKAVSSNSRQI
ncbi:galanin receptor type 1-like [Lytechinus pictus]|uniref:galanin receptor type 1-like n=1 Tax=Lytechinus pictus TaxID=7653 RepID=UPI00240E1A80|nr:galanin receptor type 1-like [Lytechinus pictus]